MAFRRRRRGRRAGYDVLMLPSDGRPARKFGLSDNAVAAGAALVLATLLLIVALFSISIAQRIELAGQRSVIHALERSRSELLTANSQQASRLHELVQEAETLQRRLRELEQLTDEVWTLLGKSPDLGDLTAAGLAGQGGPEGDGSNPAVRTSVMLSTLSHQVPLQQRELEQLRDFIVERNHRLEHTPSTWPVDGYVSSEFGVRVHPITGNRTQHNGIDIAALRGTPVYATAAGVVTYAGDRGGYGLTVVIDHGYGVETLYAHNSRIHVRPGQRVERGDLLADVGSTGVSTGPHVHYEVIVNGQPVNPRTYLP